MTSARRPVGFVARNALLSLVVFLPVLLLVVPVEDAVYGVDLGVEPAAQVGIALSLYVVFALPVLLGSLAHSALAIIGGWGGVGTLSQRTFVLAPALPLFTLLIGGLEGSGLLLERPLATVVATLLYAVSTAASARPRPEPKVKQSAPPPTPASPWDRPR